MLLFGLPAAKDEVGSEAYADDGIVQQAVRVLKSADPDLVVITDVCLCEYTSHGHCGVIVDGEVDNDSSIDLLARTAVSHARAGADLVAPSDMMDGRVAAIRDALDDAGFESTPIMSYAAKYASAFYGPFREAAESTPAVRRPARLPDGPAERPRGAARDRSRHRGGRGHRHGEAGAAVPRRAVAGARSASTCRSRRTTSAASTRCCTPPRRTAGSTASASCSRSLTAIKRAGADIIITYHAKEAARWLRGGAASWRRSPASAAEERRSSSTRRRWAGSWASQIQSRVCTDCWGEWRETSARLINHYGLNLGLPDHRQSSAA